MRLSFTTELSMVPNAITALSVFCFRQFVVLWRK
jgi:hypothetical protein